MIAGGVNCSETDVTWKIGLGVIGPGARIASLHTRATEPARVDRHGAPVVLPPDQLRPPQITETLIEREVEP